MITYYVAERGGELCKCEFINMKWAIVGWLTLVMSEEFKFRIIKKKVYDKCKGLGIRNQLIKPDTVKVVVVGYYTVKSKG